MAEASSRTRARPTVQVITSDGGIEPLGRDRAAWARGLASLVDQEVLGRRRGPVHPRVRQLLARFGFEFEPASEPGHMRFQPSAAQMLQRVTTYAEARARAIAADLGIPFDRVEGVNVIDGSAPVLRDYLRLIHGEGDLYGAQPYFLAPPRPHLLLRQTACLQKYSVAQEWDSAATVLPRCLYELSDSFRGEPEDDLQLSFRLRRFRVPEAHLHARSLDESVAQAERVHALISSDLAGHTGEVALLVTATHEFVRRHRGFLVRLTARAGAPALLKEIPPGALCQDGVEIDVEYKFVDATGFARELSTFQIDELITRSVGVSRPEAPVTTIHTVPIGSAERFVFAAFDRIARLEADGGRARLPLWLSPVAVRLAWDRDQAPPPGVVDALCLALEAHRLTVDIDDRPMPLAEKVAAADTELVPLVLLLGRASTADLVEVRCFDNERTSTMRLPDLLVDQGLHDELDAGRLPPLPRRLSARPVLTGPVSTRM
jgi:threonyl-tRNA synthetase